MRKLAPPFVMTTTLLIVGCEGRSGPPPNPPQPDPVYPNATSALVPKPVETEAPVAVPPKEPLPEAPPQAVVLRRDDGTCTVYFDDSCPPGKRCYEPPPAQTVECPPVLPAPSERETFLVTERRTCLAWTTPQCPPDALCNPPPPHPVQCKHLGKQQPVLVTAGMKVDVRSDGSCWEITGDDCPPNTKCNPPAPRPLVCAEPAKAD